MKFYFVVGERSGDLHASNLIKQLKLQHPGTEFRGLGGELMEQSGATLFKKYNEVAFMGFWEVFINLRVILKNLQEVQNDILRFAPDVIVLVDFAGFNMKIAAFAKLNNLKVFYYISPKIWAWNQKRAFKIKRLVDRMFVILPFEQEFYQKFDYKVDFVGNPVLDAIRSFSSDKDFAAQEKFTKPVIALLPGSRKQEVANMLTLLQTLSQNFPEFQFVVAAVSNLPATLYTDSLAGTGIRIVVDRTYDLLQIAYAAIVTSGTATLETALFEVPQVVVYKTSPITYTIAKSFIKVKYISLVNLVANKEVVKELIQKEFNEENLKNELKKCLYDKSFRQQQLENYKKMKETLGTIPASENTARLMLQYLKED